MRILASVVLHRIDVHQSSWRLNKAILVRLLYSPCPAEPRTEALEPFVKYPLEPVARLVDEAEGLKAQEFSSALL